MRSHLFVAAGALIAAPAYAQQVHISYADVLIDYDSNTSGLSVTDHGGTSLRGALVNSGTEIDRANIASANNFNVWLNSTVANGGGADDISIAGMVGGSDTDLGFDAYLAEFANAAAGADLDGVTFSNGVLLIRGVLAGPGGNSILNHPVAGDWTFNGTDDNPLGAGADGLNNRLTIPAGSRGAYDSGVLVFLDIFVPSFRDGASAMGFTNADDFFAAAQFHDGFISTGGDMQLTIVPEPAALTLVLAGALALRRRST